MAAILPRRLVVSPLASCTRPGVLFHVSCLSERFSSVDTDKFQDMYVAVSSHFVLVYFVFGFQGLFHRGWIPDPRKAFCTADCCLASAGS